MTKKKRGRKRSEDIPIRKQTIISDIGTILPYKTIQRILNRNNLEEKDVERGAMTCTVHKSPVWTVVILRGVRKHDYIGVTKRCLSGQKDDIDPDRALVIATSRAFDAYCSASSELS